MFDFSAQQHNNSSPSSIQWIKERLKRQMSRNNRRFGRDQQTQSAIVSLEPRVLLSGVVQEVSNALNEQLSSSNWLSPTAVGDNIYYVTDSRLGMYNATQGAQILNLTWEGQTILVGNNGTSGEVASLGTTVYFLGTNGSASARSLYSLSETGVVSRVLNTMPLQLTNVGSSIYFISENAVYQIASSGTITRIQGFSNQVDYAQNVDGKFYFQVRVSGSGFELWRATNAGGVERVFNLYPGVGSFPSNVTKVGDDLYFADKSALWRINGEDNSVERIYGDTGIAIGSPQSLTAANGTLYFVGGATGLGHGVWEINEDGDAVFLATAQPPDYIGPVTVELAVIGETIYYNANRGSIGNELWKIDSAGVSLVRDFMPGTANGFPTRLTVINEELFFLATDHTGRSLWKIDTDGLLKRLGPWTDGVSSAGKFTIINGRILTYLYDSQHGSEIWAISTDGLFERLTDAHMYQAQSPLSFISFAGQLYYLNGANSFWKIDEYGLEVLVANNVSNPTTLGNYIYFARTTSAEGNELWRLTNTGTLELVADLQSGTNSSNPSKLTNIGGVLYFQTNDSLGVNLARVLANGTVERLMGLQPYDIANDMPNKIGFYQNGYTYIHATNGTQTGLWVSSGTGSFSFLSDLSPTAIKEYNGSFYLIGSTSTVSNALWKINSSGTLSRMSNSANGQFLTSPDAMTIFGNELFFVATTASTGRELFKINTAGNAVIAHDVTAGTGSSSPRILGMSGDYLYYLTSSTVRSISTTGVQTSIGLVTQGGLSSASDYTVLNGALYYRANSSAVGNELRKMDLTTGTVTLVGNIGPGNTSSEIRAVTAFGDEIIFLAEDGDPGKDVWRVDANGVLSKIWNGDNPRESFFAFNGSLYFSGNDLIAGYNGIDTTPGNRVWKYAIPAANSLPVITDQQFSVSELAPVGTVVGQVVATDSDAGQRLRYRIVAGNNANTYRIDARTGIITVANAAYLDFEFGRNTRLVVEVTDTSKISGSSRANVDIELLNVNDAPQVEIRVGNDLILPDDVVNAGTWRQYLTATNTQLTIKNINVFPMTMVVEGVVGNLTLSTPTNMTIAAGASLTLTLIPSTRNAGQITADVSLRFESSSVSSTLDFGVEYTIVADPELQLAPLDLPGVGNSFNNTNFNRVQVGNLIYILDDNQEDIWKLESNGSMTRFNQPSTMREIQNIVESNGELYALMISYDYVESVYHVASNGTYTLIGNFPYMFDQSNLVASGGSFYISASNGLVNGQELWRMDMNGTTTLIDIRPGEEGSYPTRLMDVDGVLYFTANDGVNGLQIYRYTPADGAVRLTNLLADTGSATTQGMIPYNDELYFVTSANSVSSLWKITSADQVVLVRAFSTPIGVYVADDRMVVLQTGTFPTISVQQVGQTGWTEYDLLGTQISTIYWADTIDNRLILLVGQFNGTSAFYEVGSSQVSHLYTTPFAGRQFFAWNDSFYFSATTPAEGRELWVYTPLVSLSAYIIPDDSVSGALVGEFEPFDSSDNFTYELVAGFGDVDNAIFTINGSELRLAASVDNQNQRTRQIRVRVTDSLGNSFEKNFVISVNDPPVDIAISNQTFPENGSVVLVGNLTGNDVNFGDLLRYTIIPIAGSTDHTMFMVAGNLLYAISPANYELKSSYTIRLRVADPYGGYFDKDFTISVTNVNETPTGLTLDNTTIDENLPAGTTVGNLTTTDPDFGNTHTYTLVTGSGSADNSMFTIVGNQLQTTTSFDYEGKSEYTIRLRTTDQDGLYFEKEVNISVANLFEPVVTVDYGQPGYQEKAGVWSDSGTQYAQAGSSTRYSNSNNASVRWNTTPLSPGWYQVEFWNVAHGSNTTSALLTVQHGGQTTSSTFNHATTPVGWKTIGTFYFDGSSNDFVQLSKSGTGYLRADAVRFTIVTTINYDSGLPGYQEVSGAWSTSGTLTGLDGSATRYSNSTNASTRWNTVSLTAGWYRVELWNVAHGSNATSATITVKHHGSTTTSSFNHRTSLTGWLTVGTFYFDGTSEEFVQLSKTGPGYLRSDAVALIAVDGPPVI